MFFKHFASKKPTTRFVRKWIGRKWVKLFSCRPDVKRPTLFQRCYFLNPHQGSVMNPFWNLQHLETPFVFYNIWKLNLCSEMDSSKTTWINAWDKYTQHSLIIWLVWLNGREFVSELSGCEFKSCCRYIRTCFIL